MSHHHHHKRHNSRSRSPVIKRESQPNRRTDSYERHHPIQSNRQHDYHYPSDRSVSINEIISHTEEYPPIIQSLVRELLLEQKKRKLVEERLNISERDYALLRAQHDQTINGLTLLKHNFDQCRLDLKNSCFQVNELRHSNSQYRLHLDQLLNNERQQMYTNDETLYTKRQRRH